MSASPKEKFEAAVKVIHSLPKNGSFVPSQDLMLKLYAYYKQAKEGPCISQRPAFWDVVGKAKWDAWNKIGDMPQEEAMVLYVEELKKIVETMPHTGNVQEFVEKLGDFYEIVDENYKTKFNIKSIPKRNDKPNGNIVGSENLNGVENRVHSESSVESSPRKSETETDISLEDSEPPSSISTDDIEVATSNQNHELYSNEPITEPLTSSPQKPANQINGHGDSPVLNGAVAEFSNSDSDEDDVEFCDTSDSPHLLQMIKESEDEKDCIYKGGPPVTMGYTSPTTQQTAGLNRDPSSLEFLISPGQMVDREWISSSFNTPSPSYADVSGALTMRGGGDPQSGVGAYGQTMSMSQGGASGQGQHSQGARDKGATSRRQLLSGSGGSGGEDRGSSTNNHAEYNEQVVVALLRLQQDMSSVLSRLNTLEALTQQQATRGRQSSETNRSQNQTSPWWWPFPNLNRRTLLFVLLWPVIVHFVINFTARRRRNRRT